MRSQDGQGKAEGRTARANGILQDEAVTVACLGGEATM